MRFKKQMFVFLSVMLFWSTAVPAKVSLDQKPNAAIDHEELSELSGIIRAAQSREYWGINDSGNGADLFLFNRSGDLIQKTWLPGINNRDWEALTRDAAGNLYIGDFGDNDAERNEYLIHRVPEPVKQQNRAAEVLTYRFEYPNGESHNCEAMFLLGGKIYLITKEKKEAPLVYCLDELVSGKRVTARLVGRMPLEGIVTDAAYAEEQGLLAVLSKKSVAFLSVRSEADLLQTPQQEFKVDFGKCEGICFDGNEVIVTNEKGDIWHYPIHTLVRK